MGVFEELVKILSEDVDLFEDKERFLNSLEIPRTTVDAYVKLFDMGHCRAYNLIKSMLSEWITIKKDSATIAELRRILREADFGGCSDELKILQEMHPGPIKTGLETSTRNDSLGTIPQPHSSGNPPPMEITKRPITFGLKSVVQNFTGREEELGRLNQYFHSRECPIVLVSGLGGIGKTELSKKFALDISNPSGNGQIVKCWLSGENAQSLLNSTSQFCDQLQLPSKREDGQPLRIQEMIQNIMAKLKSSEEFSRWVIIIDNLDQIHEQFEATVQSLSEFGSDAFLLITSRRIDIFPGELELLEVTTMQLTDSMAFVRKSLKIADDLSGDAIKSLCLQLDNLPLALSQATAFIRQQQTLTLKRGAYSIQNYLDELAKNETLGLDKDRKLGYSTATLKVWVITIDKIRECHGTEGQIALDLLDSMAFINPDEISIQFLHKLYQIFYSIEEIAMSQIKDSLTILLNYSLISSYDEILSIHRLVQLALRDRMSSKPATDGESSKAVEMLTKFLSSFDVAEWHRIEMQNLLVIWNHGTKHKKLDIHRAAKIHQFNNQLYQLGLVDEFYNFAVEGSKFLLEIYGPQHEEYLKMEFSVALALTEKGQYESALEKFKTLHSKFKERSGANYALTVTTGYRIAGVFYHLKMFQRCLEWAQKVLESQIQISGERNKDAMKTKNLIALTLKELGKKKEAEETFNEILKWQEVNLGAYHEATLITRHNFAICLYEAGVFAEALAIFQEVLPPQEKEFGADHPNTILRKGWLADTFWAMGEHGKALKLWEEVVVASEKVFGPNHPQTIVARERVAGIQERL